MTDPLFSFSVYFSEMLITYVFCVNISEKRYNFIISMAIGSITFGVGALLNILGETNYVLNACSMLVIHFLFILVCFRMDITTSAFYTIILCGLSTALQFGTVSAISTLTGGQFTDINHDYMLLAMETFICKSLYFIFSLLLLKILSFLKISSYEKESAHFPLSATVQPLITLVIILAFYYVCMQEEISRRGQSLFAIICIAALGTTIFLVLHNMQQIEQEQEYMRMRSEVTQLEHEKNYYDILDRQNQQLMMYAHDAKNHLVAIRDLSEDPQIRGYVDKLSDELERYTQSCHSGNKLLDVILNRYVLECQKRGLAFEYNVKVCNLRDVEDMDLVTILGNLLDNAIEAAEKSQEKTVYLETSLRNAYQVIVIQNSSLPPRESYGRLQTSKPDRSMHGFGLKSVAKCLKKYNGDLHWDYDEDDHVFTMTVMIDTVLQDKAVTE